MKSEVLDNPIVIRRKGISSRIPEVIYIGGQIKEASQYRTELAAADCQMGYWGKDVLGRIIFKSRPKTEVKLFVRSVLELGFEKWASRSDIYDAADEKGLKLCPPEVALILRIIYSKKQPKQPKQPADEWLFVGMEPVIDSAGCPRIFVIETVRNGKPFLRARADELLESHRFLLFCQMSSLK